MAKKSDIEKGEALPPMGGNIISAFIMSCISTLIAISFGFGTLKLELESKIKALLPENADPLALPMAAGLLHIFVMQWLAMMVNNARVRYGVAWPWLYAEKSHPNAIPYNCAQRAHQHYLEQTIMVGIILVIAASEFPNTAGAGTIVFTFSKILGNVVGYNSGNASRRNWGGFGYIGLLAVLGLAFFAVVKKFGVDLQPLVENAVETAKPYCIAAYEKAKPIAEKCIEKAMPYVEAAGEKVKPYYDQAMANEYVGKAAGYAGTAFESAKAGFDSAKTGMGY